jgi:hypothetical protein
MLPSSTSRWHQHPAAAKLMLASLARQSQAVSHNGCHCCCCMCGLQIFEDVLSLALTTTGGRCDLLWCCAALTKFGSTVSKLDLLPVHHTNLPRLCCCISTGCSRPACCRALACMPQHLPCVVCCPAYPLLSCHLLHLAPLAHACC